MLGAGPAGAADSAPLLLTLNGSPRQSGLLIGRTAPGARIESGGLSYNAGTDGVFLLGFDRDAPAGTELVVTAGRQTLRRALQVAPRVWQVRRVSGLPPATVSPPPELQARLAREVELKQRAFAHVEPGGRGFLDGFVWPLETVRITSPWGAARRLNDRIERPHHGIDLAAPAGAPIRAPAAGRVVLAEPDMHFEGGLTAIDHGEGLISLYLHQSRIDVRPGATVSRGQIIGQVGARGRATGPHLCWRLRWRGRHLDPSLLVRA